MEEIEQGQRPEIFSNQDYEDLENIEKEKFKEGEYSSLEEVVENLTNTKGIQIFFRKEGKLEGYLSSKSASEAEENFSEVGLEDPQFDPSSSTLYLESIVGDLEGVNFQNVVDNLKEKAKESGYSKIALHGINKRLNKVLSRYGFQKQRKVEKWLGGNTAEYMEVDLE